MEADEDAALVCLRVTEGSISSVVAGCIQKTCTECDHRVWVAKAGQNLLNTHTGTVTIICDQCAIPYIQDPDNRKEIAPGALEELRDHFRGR